MPRQKPLPATPRTGPPSSAPVPPKPRESDLYAPVKAHLQALGYEVRAEVGSCDVIGVYGDTVVAVELKLAFGLPVLYQALQRLPSVDLVYVAVAVPPGRKARGNWDAQLGNAVRICRMLGIGLLSVGDSALIVHADPAPYQPRKQPRRRVRLLNEFHRRSGDHNVGGTNRRPRVTAYREDALSCVRILAQAGPMQPARLRDAAQVPKAAAILRGNVYGWFIKVARGLYDVTADGRAALELYADVVLARYRDLRDQDQPTEQKVIPAE